MNSFLEQWTSTVPRELRSRGRAGAQHLSQIGHGPDELANTIIQIYFPLLINLSLQGSVYLFIYTIARTHNGTRELFRQRE